MAVPPLAFVDALEDTWTALAVLCAELTDEQWDTATGVPGWSVRDNVAHVVGFETSLMGADPSEAHRVAGDPEHVRNDFGRVMERQVDFRRGWQPEQVLAELVDVTARRLHELRTNPALLESEVRSPFGPLPLQRMLPTRVFDCYAHEQDVRRALGQPGHLTGPAPERTWGTVTRQLARVLPDRVPDLAGRSVVLEADPMGSAGLLGEGAADLHLRVDYAELMALVCGRSDADPDAVEVVHGDAGLLPVLVPALVITP